MRNSAAAESGVQDFRVELSNNGGTWYNAVSGKLDDIRGKGCDEQPSAMSFSFTRQYARYARFVVVSFYGEAGALQFFKLSGKGKWLSFKEKELSLSLLHRPTRYTWSPRILSCPEQEPIYDTELDVIKNRIRFFLPFLLAQSTFNKIHFENTFKGI